MVVPENGQAFDLGRSGDPYPLCWTFLCLSLQAIWRGWGGRAWAQATCRPIRMSDARGRRDAERLSRSTCLPIDSYLDVAPIGDAEAGVAVFHRLGAQSVGSAASMPGS
jgi:hypothetical protein